MLMKQVGKGVKFCASTLGHGFACWPGRAQFRGSVTQGSVQCKGYYENRTIISYWTVATFTTKNAFHHSQRLMICKPGITKFGLNTNELQQSYRVT